MSQSIAAPSTGWFLHIAVGTLSVVFASVAKIALHCVDNNQVVEYITLDSGEVYLHADGQPLAVVGPSLLPHTYTMQVIESVVSVVNAP